MFLVAHIKMKDVFDVVKTIHIKHLAKFMKSFEYLYDANKLANFMNHWNGIVNEYG